MFLTALVFDGVFERFPALRGGVIELGAGWVPEYLRTLDLSQKIFKRTDPQVAALSLQGLGVHPPRGEASRRSRAKTWAA